MNTYKFPLILTVLVLYCIPCYGLKLHRVILATDANPTYLHFWPIVAKTWKNLVGLQPTLALIADESVKVDETLGDVIRFKPIPGVPTAQHAQIIRLFLPAFFQDEGCIISDIDMIPLSRDYFIKSVAAIPDNCFAVYRDGAYHNVNKFPMCYNAALGKTYAEIFNIKKLSDIPILIKQWLSLGYGWNTDEIQLYKCLTQWKDYQRRCIRLNHDVTQRIDRSNWNYDPAKVRAGFYIDAHCLRPYGSYRKEIDVLTSHLPLITLETHEK